MIPSYYFVSEDNKTAITWHYSFFAIPDLAGNGELEKLYWSVATLCHMVSH